MISRAKTFLNSLLPESSFARGVGVLVGGTGGAQALFIVFAPVLTRIYTPGDFGVLAVYSSLLFIIGVVASLRYELAIPLPEDNQDAANVAALCLGIVVTNSLLVGVVVSVWGTPVASSLGVPPLADYFWLLPLGILLSGAYTVFNYWGTRHRQFQAIARTRLRQAIAALAVQLAAYKAGGIALIFGQVVGQSVGTSSLAVAALSRPEFKRLSLAGIRKVASRYSDFPRYSTWSGLINTAGQEIPPIVFAASFSAGAAGLYALAHRILSLPASLLGAAVGQVFFAHAADDRRKGRLGTLYAELQTSLVHIGMPPTVFLVVAGPELFSLAFGAQWREAGVFARWLAIGIFGGFVVSPLSQIFTVLEKQQTGLALQLLLFVARLSGILVGVLYGNLLLAVALFSTGSLIGYAGYIVVGARYTGCPLRSIAGSLAGALVVSCVIALPLLASALIEREEAVVVGLIVSGVAVIWRVMHAMKTSRV